MKILLLGKEGQVGSELSRTLLPLGTVIALGRRDLDLSNFFKLEQLLQNLQPNLIVNAAAYTAVDKAENEREVAFLINETMVAVLAAYAKKANALLIHYSTDYVFDGEKEKAYVENDVANPLNVYGLSKLAGEQAVITSHCDFLIFRTSWVFAAVGNNFIKTILKLAREKDSLRVVTDQYGAPTSAELIAEITALAIVAYQKGQLEKGIYHLTASGVTSWYDLACCIITNALEYGIALKLNAKHITPITTSEYPTPAKRPKNSQLNTNLLSSQLSIQLPDWAMGVDRTLEQLAIIHS